MSSARGRPSSICFKLSSLRRTSEGRLIVFDRLENGGLSLGLVHDLHCEPKAAIRVVAAASIRTRDTGRVVRAAIAAIGELIIVYDITASRVVASHARHDAQVTSLAFYAASGHILSGDAGGSVIIADSGLVSGELGHSAVTMPTALVGGLEPRAPITQLELAPTDPTALELTCAISTTARLYILHIPAIALGQSLTTMQTAFNGIPVGKKPRDGDFGAAFHIPSCSNSTAKCRRLAFASRPAKRMWIVDIDTATVVLTVK